MIPRMPFVQSTATGRASWADNTAPTPLAKLSIRVVSAFGLTFKSHCARTYFHRCFVHDRPPHVVFYILNKHVPEVYPFVNKKVSC